MSKHDDGFSLVEMVVAVVIIGLLAGGIIAVTNMMNNNFSKAQFESQLQMESQAINTKMGQLIRNSSFCKTYDLADRRIVELGVYEDGTEDLVYYYLTVANNRAFLSSYATRVDDVNTIPYDSYSFLADFVVSVDVLPSEYDVSLVGVDTVDFSVYLTYGSITTELNQTIRLRNGR